MPRTRKVVEVTQHNTTQHNTTQHNTMTSLPSAKRTKLQYECPTRALVSVSGKGNYRRAIKAREEWLIHNGWSSVTTGASATKLPDHIKYMVVDVETHNWKEGTNVPNKRP